MPRIPTHRAPTHPGEILVEEFLSPMGVTQSEAARAIGVSFQRLNGVACGRRDVTMSTALRLARYLGTTPEFWINLQRNVDLYEAMQAEAAAIAAITPFAPRAEPASGRLAA